jgi:hypothetical protein
VQHRAFAHAAALGERRDHLVLLAHIVSCFECRNSLWWSG